MGDGALRYGSERIAEVRYNCALMPHLAVSLDFQYVVHPGYNRDRGPAPIVGLRIHAGF